MNRAEQSLETLEQRLSDLQSELEGEVAKLQGEFDSQIVAVESDEVKPRKADIEVTAIGLAWVA